MFPINAAAMPAVPTRKALIVVDLQNDFVSRDGALPVTEPEGFLDRTLELVKVFRDSGAGDVVWVRSEFEQHRALATEGNTILATDFPPLPATSARGRRTASKEHELKLMEVDEESFLTFVDGVDKPECVRKGTTGADFPSDVQANIVRGRDFVTTKSHYSAFAPSQSQLIQQLRMRFVTEMYVCGSLTNVGVFATALEAGKHAYDITVVEDCCGYRSYPRHVNTIHQLEKLTGCELLDSPALIDKLQRARPKDLARPAYATNPSSGSRDVKKPGEAQESKQKEDQIQPVSPSPSAAHSTGLSPTMAKVLIDSNNITPIEPPVPLQRATKSGSPTTQHLQRQASSNANVPFTQPMATHGDLSNRLIDGLAPLEVASVDEVDNLESELLAINRRHVGRISQSPPGYSGVLGTEVAEGASPSPSSNDTKAAKPRSRRNKTSKSSSSSSQSQVRGNNKDRISAEAQEAIKDTPPNPATSKQPDPNNLHSSTETLDTLTKTSSTTMEDHQKSSVSEPLCEGDTSVIPNALSPDLAADAFERLLEEVSWAGMSHLGGEVPRRIAVQGAIDEEGNMPVYRHPADESPPLLPFSPTVIAIKNEIEKHLGHPLNHVLIQHYRNSNDYISEHSDKSLDIVRGSYIANVSLGAERTMVLRTKRPPKDKEKKDAPTATGTETPSTAAEKAKRQIQRAPLPHNSLLRMGLQTNMRWLHAIRPDKRSDRDKSASELAYNGARISLTFRQIGTFLNSSQTKIWGQGAVGKTKEEAQPVVNGQTDEAVRMLQAFGNENHSSEFDWEKNYGAGFNVLHMGSPKRFFAGSVKGKPCTVENMRVALALADMGIGAAKGAIDASASDEVVKKFEGWQVVGKVIVKFVDNDPARTEVVGDISILSYLDAVYGAGRRYDQMTPTQVSKRFMRLQEADKQWADYGFLLGQPGDKPEDVKRWLKDRKELMNWEVYAKEAYNAAAKTGTTTTTTAESKTVTPEISISEEQQPEQKPDETNQKDKTTDATGQLQPFYICGGEAPSPVDYALWPMLHQAVTNAGGDEDALSLRDGYLLKYYKAFKQRSAVAKVLGNTASLATPASTSGDGEQKATGVAKEKQEEPTICVAQEKETGKGTSTEGSTAVEDGDDTKGKDEEAKEPGEKDDDKEGK